MQNNLKFCIILLLINFISFKIFSQKKLNKTELSFEIEKAIGNTPGRFAVAFKNLQTKETYFLNEHEYFHAASTMKTPVMMEVFRLVDEKKIKLNDSILIVNKFKSIIDGSEYSLDLGTDSDDLVYNNIGKKMTIESLVYQMITVSSNFATNILIDIVGAQNVMKYLHSFGIKETKVLRGVEDSKAFKAGKNNETTAFGLMQIFEIIASNKKLNPKMTEILLDQNFKELIPAKLPKNVKVAHKSGSITGVQHDSGFVILPDGRKYVIVLLSKNLEKAEDGVNVLSEISRIIFGKVQ